MHYQTSGIFWESLTSMRLVVILSCPAKLEMRDILFITHVVDRYRVKLEEVAQLPHLVELHDVEISTIDQKETRFVTCTVNILFPNEPPVHVIDHDILFGADIIFTSKRYLVERYTVYQVGGKDPKPFSRIRAQQDKNDTQDTNNALKHALEINDQGVGPEF